MKLFSFIFRHKNASVRKATAMFLERIVDRMGPGRVLSGIKDVTDKVLPNAASFALDSAQETRYGLIYKVCKNYECHVLPCRPRSWIQIFLLKEEEFWETCSQVMLVFRREVLKFQGKFWHFCTENTKVMKNLPTFLGINSFPALGRSILYKKWI